MLFHLPCDVLCSPLFDAFGWVFDEGSVDRSSEEWSSGDASLYDEACERVKLERWDDKSCMLSWSTRHAGDYRWRIECDGTDVSPEDAMVHVASGKMDLKKCILFGYGLRFAVAGIRSHFMLQVRFSLLTNGRS